MVERRKLAAFLSMDVAGYSRLIQRDDRRTVACLKHCHEVVSRISAGHGGRVVNTSGDALLAEFPSAVEAVDAALAIQDELGTWNREVPEDQRMQLRIGAHLGEVIEDEAGAVFGDGVNIAARLESLAEPGGIRVSAAVKEAALGRIDAAFVFAGEHRVKNISQPIQAYSVRTGSNADSGAAMGNDARRRIGFLVLVASAVAATVLIGTWSWFRTAGEGVSQPSAAVSGVAGALKGPAIAVLPLDNMSGDSREDFFGDGIAEEIISGLSRFSNLRVLARNSTFQYRSKATDVRRIAKEIGADYVVMGSVRRVSDTVRVTVQLLDAAKGTHVWAESYDRKLTPESLFAVQDDITAQVVTRIGDVHGAVNRAQVQPVRSKAPESLEDYECILRTYEYQRFLTPDKHGATKTCLENTVRRNPDYAEAWANLAYNYTDQYWTGYEGPSDPLVKAFEAARRAVDLDPTSPTAHYALANVYFFQGRIDSFVNEADKALALNANNTEIVAALGVRFTYGEMRERGLELIERAIALNPAHPGWYYFPVAYHYYRKSEYSTALEYTKRIDMPGFWYTHLWQAAIYGQLGDSREARESISKLVAINPSFEADPKRYLRLWFKSDEAVGQWVDGLRKAGIQID